MGLWGGVAGRAVWRARGGRSRPRPAPPWSPAAHPPRVSDARPAARPRSHASPPDCPSAPALLLPLRCRRAFAHASAPRSRRVGTLRPEQAPGRSAQVHPRYRPSYIACSPDPLSGCCPPVLGGRPFNALQTLKRRMRCAVTQHQDHAKCSSCVKWIFSLVVVHPCTLILLCYFTGKSMSVQI